MPSFASFDFQFTERIALVHLHNSAVDSKRIIGNIFRHRSSCCSIDCLSKLDRSDKIGIAADKTVIADNTASLGDSVIVYGNCSAAYIYSPADVTVADIRKVCDRSLFADN